MHLIVWGTRLFVCFWGLVETKTKENLSIHPSTCAFWDLGHRRGSLTERGPDFHVPGHLLQLFWGNSEPSPNQRWFKFSVFWVRLGASSRLDTPGAPPRESIQGASSRFPSITISKHSITSRLQLVHGHYVNQRRLCVNNSEDLEEIWTMYEERVSWSFKEDILLESTEPF